MWLKEEQQREINGLVYLVTFSIGACEPALDLGLGRLGSCPGASTKKGLHKSTFFLKIWLCRTVNVIGACLATFASFILITRFILK